MAEGIKLTSTETTVNCCPFLTKSASFRLHSCHRVDYIRKTCKSARTGLSCNQLIAALVPHVTIAPIKGRCVGHYTVLGHAGAEIKT